MDSQNKRLADVYIASPEMEAVGMVNFPEIGKVAHELQMLRVPTPRPSEGEVTVKIAASALHIDEIYAAQGTALGRLYGPKNISISSPALLGSCATGKIVGLGHGVDKFKIGDDVIIIPPERPQSGSWATYQCFEEKWIMPKPTQLTHVEASAVTMAACVAWGAIGFANIKPGDHCVVVGASGAIGVMILQFLKSLECNVTAVCSGNSEPFARAYGADGVVDYTKEDFGDAAISSGVKYDVVFDCVGGREIEASAFKSLKKSGDFVTLVGPKQYIGQEKLSWPAFAKVMGYVAMRMAITRVKTGPKYTFGEKYPRLVVADAMAQLLKYDIRMPVPLTIPFEIGAIKDAVCKLITHREKGRTVIDFAMNVQ